MSIDEFSQVLAQRVKLLESPAIRERLSLVAANQVSALVKRRVFRDGIAQDGNSIGNYSTKPAWFPAKGKGLPALAPKGKPPSKRAKKTVYSSQGYKGYREMVGRQSNVVDLNLTGSTFNGVGTGVGPSGIPAFGIKTKEAIDIIDGNEQRFNKVTITPNAAEVKAGREAAQNELKFILGL